jgi:PTH1 family peptidyl-tRNA hydrolase
MGSLLEFTKTTLEGVEVILAKPMTFMNNSGDAVLQLLSRYPVERERMVVIFDDADLPLGTIRIRERGSAGTHKGMKSIVRAIGTQDFPRFRIGIHDSRGRVAGMTRYVLAPLKGKKLELFHLGVFGAADAALSVLRTDIRTAMNTYNRRTDSLLLEKEAHQTKRRKNEQSV